ncbi:flavin reductase [Neomoorella humiferrea]|uniref:High molecular weight rubredoxin n=1 Tax=Neomoorella humiferrea TaxID=676965 RepID=A0A2T0AVC1_9FIRM|nr:High molecular weight rubredoxin [Moorella humiferrea]
MDTKALYTISYGLYIVTAKKDDRLNGQVANTVFQISSAPPTVAVSINKQNLTHEFIQAGRNFAVSVLAREAPLSLIGRFGFKSGREVDKFAGLNYKLTQGGLPYLAEDTLAYLEAEVNQTVDAGTHSIFIGTLRDAAVLRQGEPMTYAYYHQVKRGTTPQTAPTFAAARVESGPAAAAPRYRCTICNYIYDPTQGDPEHGIASGTPFEDLPGDWACPICGAGKDAFEKI